MVDHNGKNNLKLSHGEKSLVVNDETQEELRLAFQGLTKLIEEGVRYNNEKIISLLHTYPSMKKEKIKDVNFQNLFFMFFKRDFIEDTHRHFFNHKILEKECEILPFLRKKILQDEEMQKMFSEEINTNIRYIEYGFHSSHDEKLSSRLEDIVQGYQNKYIKDTVKRENLDDLLVGANKRLDYYQKDKDLQKIYESVMNCILVCKGQGESIFQEILLERRKHKNYDPIFLSFDKFPKGKLKDNDVKEDIFDCVLSNMSEGWNDKIVEKLIGYYSFIKKDINTCINIILQQKENIYNPNEAKTFKKEKKLLRSIAYGLKFRLNIVHMEAVRSFLQPYEKIKNFLPREIVIEGVSNGLNADDSKFHDKKENSPLEHKLKMLEDFPLTQEEKEKHLINLFLHQKKNVGYFSYKNAFEFFQNTLKLFEGTNLEKVFQQQEIKEYFIQQITSMYWLNIYETSNDVSLENIDFIATTVGLSQDELNDIALKAMKMILEKAANLEENHRSYNILGIFSRIKEYCITTEKLQQEIQSEEVKKGLHIIAQRKIGDFSHNFAGDFANDERIRKLCENDLFPFSIEEVEEDVWNVFLNGLSQCYINGFWMEHFLTNYKCIQPRIEKQEEELVEAVIQGLISILSPNYRYSDLSFRRNQIDDIIKYIPFMRAKREDERIQQAITHLSNLFLSTGDSFSYNKVKAWGKLDVILQYDKELHRK